MDRHPSRSHSGPDLQRFGLRAFLASLPGDELEREAAPVALADVAARLDGNPRAVWFEGLEGSSFSLCGNVAGSRARLAAAFGTTADRVLPEILSRLRKPGELVEVPRAHAPVQEVVLTGDECDLTALPVHLQHEFDGAPYISASVDFVHDPSAGHTNVGMRRLMLRGRRVAGVDLVAPSDLRAIYLARAERGERTPVAFAIGSHPVDQLAATLRFPGDELALVAALRAQPLGVVKCVTNDLLVPADAQMILEGYFDERGHVEPEGPFGEFLGYYGAVKRNPLFHLTAITHRRDAIFQTSSIGGPSMHCTDTAQLCSLRTEILVWKALEAAVRDVRAVYAPAAAGGSFNVRIALQQRVPGEARNAIAAAFGCLGNVKNVFVVDPDIDIYSDAQMEWALATRFQPGRDLVVQSGLRTVPLDPSLDGSRITDKAGFDLTLPLLAPGARRPIEHEVPHPPSFGSPRHVSLDAALESGPKFFAELMAAIGTRDGREVVRWLEDTAPRRPVVRDSEGRYCFG
ncbi:3-octaprenyl-4-hydroxybenzoate carboxy-lyase [Pigmentiphaga humi]|uniref:3-octaprenyl-4-hydroxybenzoate carboxy-lyase n=1 Tax=Pigmentiphaga humi TaxID=2478468 RepID=A0A3P4B5Y5_9BURK|nr:UbiD family decarboxylase [Pigmentiphaga humi]VCU71472.1 3-octaprenyl-4-hydroxybenzoate carboxy-lyase [Pigmentiphaga humi]